MKIINAEWEKRNIGVSTAEISIEEEDTFADLQAIQRELDKSYEYICLKCKTNAPDFLFGLNKLGYTFIETQIALEFKSKKYQVPDELTHLINQYKGRISFIKVEDEIRLESVLGKIRDQEMFLTDRIYLDPVFSSDKSGKRYYCWCKDAYQNGGMIYEIIVDDVPVGMNALNKPSGTAYSGIVGGVYPDHNDYAFLTPIIGHLFFQYLIAQGMRSLKSAVSSNNKSMLKLNLSSGYQVADVYHVYVKHQKGKE